MTTVYPSEIDNNITLPRSIDLVTPVKAEVVNDLRTAIIAIENELGISPSGSYSTVKARLDDLSSGGGSGSIVTKDTGIIIVNPTTALNFIGPNVTVTDGGNCQADVTISGDDIEVVQESIAVTSGDENNFTLSTTPSSASAVQMYVNGQKIQYGTDYTVTGNVATYIGTDFVLTISDDVEFYYVVTGGLAYQETVAVTSIGQTSFSISREPMNGSVVQMFINGLKQQYGVDYSVSTSTITYLGSLLLGTTDDVEFWYITYAAASSGDTTTFVNVGTGSEVLVGKTGSVVNYRTLVGTNNIYVSENGDEIEIDGYNLATLEYVDGYTTPTSIEVALGDTEVLLDIAITSQTEASKVYRGLISVDVHIWDSTDTGVDGIVTIREAGVHVTTDSSNVATVRSSDLLLILPDYTDLSAGLSTTTVTVTPSATDGFVISCYQNSVTTAKCKCTFKITSLEELV